MPDITFVATESVYTQLETPDTVQVGTQIDSGNYTGSETRRGYARFDFSTYAGFTVTSAKLRIYDGGGDLGTNTRTKRVYQCKRAWVKAQTTWNEYATSTSWQTAGGTGANDITTEMGSFSAPATEVAGWVEVTLTTSMAQDWLDGDITEQSVFIKTDTESYDMHRYNGSTGGNPPEVVLTLDSSPSPSLSPSLSPSSSSSSSESSSASLSPSLSPSASASPSSSDSPSISLSTSLSPSVSESPSPSTGYTGYTRGNYAVLPTNDDDLETTYTAQDVLDVATADDIRVDQDATNEFMIHEYKNFVGDQPSCQLNWEGQTTLAPATSTIYLQIYNRNTTTWDTVDSDNSSSVNTDFVLFASIADLTNYIDATNLISCRIYQDAM